MRSDVIARWRDAAAALGLAACAAAAGAADIAIARAAHAAPQRAASQAKPVASIDINSASRAQLKTLPGIGDVEADRIISGRPYLSKAELATRDAIPTGVYLSLKDRVIAKQKSARPPPRTP
jgi:competence protein ComEA